MLLKTIKNIFKYIIGIPLDYISHRFGQDVEIGVIMILILGVITVPIWIIFGSASASYFVIGMGTFLGFAYYTLFIA